jgi:hypothetical protein
MVTDFTSIATFIIAGLVLTSFALLRARALRVARANATRSAKHLLRDSAH